MSRHFIGMAGMHGCLPSFCEVYPTISDASHSLAELHEIPDHLRFQLLLDRYLDLPRGAGNDYVSIEQCDCDTPEVHSDSA